MIHVVKPGETVAGIAAAYGVSPSRILFDNQIRDASLLVVGQALLILIPEETYTVRPGDTLQEIGALYGLTVRELVRRNPFLLDSGNLYAGENIVIRYGSERTGAGYDSPKVMGGYLYPFAESYIIRQSMLYLTDMYLFSYGFTAEGGLVLPRQQGSWIAMARSFGVRPVLVLTPLTEEGTFNSYLVTVLVENPPVQEVLIENLLEEMRREGYEALDVDFEFIEAGDKELFVEFIRHLTERMNAEGYPVSVALAPKNADDQPGSVYEGLDYRALGEAANSVLVMAYEWGYTYGPPMAVAPLDQVRRVVEYAVSRIDPAKIALGIPNYGYDWKLPYERGVTRARVVGNVEAVELAGAMGSEILFDETAQSPYFTYSAAGQEHVVWFEDVRSMMARFDLIAEYGLRGAGYWNLMRPFRANWLLWNHTFPLQM